MALDKLSSLTVMSIKVHLKITYAMALAYASSDLLDLFTEANGVMANLKAMEHFLHYQTRLLKQDLTAIM